MRYIRLGNSALRASAIGLGALHFGSYLDARAARELVDQAHGLGINLIDTAPLYGHGSSESLVGQAVAGRRGEFLIATKVGLAPRTLPDGSFGVQVKPLTGEEIRTSVEKSLERLGTDYIDLLQLHAFDAGTPMDETLGALDRLLAQGKIRAAGCSNYSPAELDILLARPLHGLMSTSQCHFNVIERRAETELIPRCRQSALSVICNRVLARGVLTGRYSFGREPPRGTRAADSKRVRQLLRGDTLALVGQLEEFARTNSKSVAQLAVAWVLSTEGVSVALVGARDTAQLLHVAAGADWDLTARDRRQIDDLIGRSGQAAAVAAKPELFFET